jgi:STE24 endopeptidase
VPLLVGTLDLPLAIYRTFVIEARFGFNRITPALFVADLARSIAISLALGVPLVLLVLWLMQGWADTGGSTSGSPGWRSTSRS